MKTLDVAQLAGALASLPDNPRIVVSGNFATPQGLLKAVDAVLPRYRLYAINAQGSLPNREGVTLETSFVGPGMRHHDNVHYVPSRLSLVPRLFAGPLKPDLVLLHTTTPRHGLVSMGIEVNVLPAAVDSANARGGLVLAQLNRHMPFTHGDGVLETADVDYGVELEEVLPAPPPRGIDDESRLIGERVAGLVPDGATMQLGIGAVPDAVLDGLTKRRGLKLWTEMFSDGLLTLERSGALADDAVITSSFLFGTPELYEWVDDNPRVLLRRSEITNDPARIAEQTRMTSVNTALQIDLFGQANASRINARIYSGFGGQTDFIVGALHCPGGHAVMALKSWHPKADVSTVVPLVGEPVTSFQPSAVVTEQGVAELYGVDEKGQAARIIEQAAHPRARDHLWEKAAELGLT